MRLAMLAGFLALVFFLVRIMWKKTVSEAVQEKESRIESEKKAIEEAFNSHLESDLLKAKKASGTAKKRIEANETKNLSELNLDEIRKRGL